MAAPPARSEASSGELDGEIADPSYEEIRAVVGPRSGLTVAVAVHRTVDGHSLGGCRMKPYPSALEAVRDVKRLARAMTMKAAVSGLRMGGGKGVIALPAGAAGPLDSERRRAALHDFAELVDSLGGRYVTAQDVGTSEDDLALIGTLTPHMSGRRIAEGGAGDPSPHTALGVEVAIRASIGDRELEGLRVAVIGAGHVGAPLARSLAASGASLLIADVDPARRSLTEQIGARWVEPEEALTADVDVLSPCALGGILNPETLPRLRASVIAGAANNQLSEDGVAAGLASCGIRWAPDFVANAGGVIAVTDEYLSGGRSHRDRVRTQIGRIADTLSEVYARASDGNTLTAAVELARERAH